MSSDSTPELTSWKEIAQRLQVSVRTAQLWEKERGLPVRRVPGKRGRVYLLEEDLATWLRGHQQAADPPLPGAWDAPEAADTARSEPGETRPRMPAPGPASDALREILRPLRVLAFLVALVGLTLAILFAATVLPSRHGPAIWRIEPDTLVVTDRMGHPLFRKYFPEGLREDTYAAGENFEPRLADLDGDGTNEVIFTAFTEQLNGQRLIVYDARGNELWGHRPGLLVSTAREAFDDIYTVSDVHVLPLADGRQDVLVSAHHGIFYPNVLTRLSSSGEVVARYWHAGHLAAGPHRLVLLDVDNDGRTEILVTGVSNARNAATLILLDPDDMDGAASEAGLDYSFQQLPAARELARIYFPRSSLTPPEDRYTVAETIVPGRSTVTVSVGQQLGRGAPRVLYTFGRDLGLLNVSAGDDFIGRFRQARLAGRITHSLEDELAALEALTHAATPRGGQLMAAPLEPDRPD